MKKSSDDQHQAVTTTTETSGNAPASPSPATQDERRQHRVALCKWLLTLRLSGRLDELMEHFTPDCELHIAGGSNLSPYAGRYHGRDAVKAKLRSLHTSIEHLEFEPLSFVIDGDDVAIRWRSRGRNRGAGPAKWLEGMTLLKFRNDLVAYYGNFLDTAMMADLTGWPAPSQD